MVADDGIDILARVAGGETLELDAWPALQIDILARLEKIAHTEFAIPSLPPPPRLRRSLDNGAAVSSSPTAEPSSQEADKENAPLPAAREARGGGDKTEQQRTQPTETTTTTTGDDGDTVMEKPDEASTETPTREVSTQTNTQQPPVEPSAETIATDDSGGTSSLPKLPIQLAAMLGDIQSHIRTFVQAPPHTLQRLAELVLRPRAHYRALATYLHAVDRVVQVTSGLNTYPLPPAIPDMSSMHINGADGSKDPAAAVSWSTPTAGANSNSAAAAVGSDEALGGALLTPIPWLTRRSPESVDATSTSSGAGSTSTGGASSSSGAGGSGGGAQIHSECTETIDGPNGMGSIETVSVSVNGVPSTGHARGVTQGELLRQEQRAGVVPVSQLSRNGGHPGHSMQQQQQQPLQSQREAGASHGDGSDEEDDEEDGEHHQRRHPDHQPMDEEQRRPPNAATDDDDGVDGYKNEDDDEEGIPHARGPDEIGVNDTGPQTATTSAMGEGGLEMQGIDVAAAVGRPREQEEHPQARKRSSTPEEGGEHADAETESTATEEEATGTKREAEDAAEREPAKKVKEE
ncbi:Protein phosphatase 4 core regulatory subunit R2 [Cordyceps fumosorosea ARSEF 2679]|uniref:Protein phosphatase 4 core regulatory subunit R2 n=1 Tax=Cordyceps fumosorosea (strain ARSEF 2679) TaxID=1081104 RepID=A0A168AIP2_CORFA|nr:Protein phosphatase 4 core regulatory subunit R2 [Cordyceps fumosorosea ARSEF 2679]OAA68805.1 Protein phosphatase 4 core regulatory subunit R2 [Cordyceps fumosorosea ARSEF 2679]